MTEDPKRPQPGPEPAGKRPTPDAGGFRVTASRLGGVPITGRTQAEIRESIRRALIASGDLEE